MSEAGTWVAVAMAAISMALAMFREWNARKTKRDELEFSAEMAQLRVKVQSCEDKHNLTERELAAAHREIREMREMRRRDREELIGRDSADKAEIMERINQIQGGSP